MVRYSQFASWTVHVVVEVMFPAQSGVTANMSTRSASFSALLTLVWIPFGLLAAIYMGVAVAANDNPKWHWLMALMMSLLCGICSAQFWPGEVLISAVGFAMLQIITLSAGLLITWLLCKQPLASNVLNVLHLTSLFLSISAAVLCPIFYLFVAVVISMNAEILIPHLPSTLVTIVTSCFSVIITGVIWKKRPI